MSRDADPANSVESVFFEGFCDPPMDCAVVGDPDAALQGLIFDSHFDQYRGVVSSVRVVNGTLRQGEKLRMMSTGRSHGVDKLGCFTPKSMALPALSAGEVGFVIAGIKEIDGAPVGDTITMETEQSTYEGTVVGKQFKGQRRCHRSWRYHGWDESRRMVGLDDGGNRFATNRELFCR